LDFVAVAALVGGSVAVLVDRFESFDGAALHLTRVDPGA